jgi:hypothetical protein
VADVQVAVGLRRKAGHDAGVFARFEVVGDDLADKIERAGGLGSGHSLAFLCMPRQIFPENVSNRENNSIGREVVWGTVGIVKMPQTLKARVIVVPWRGVAGDADFAAVGLHDFLADGQPQAAAPGLGGVKGVQAFLQDSGDMPSPVSPMSTSTWSSWRRLATVRVPPWGMASRAFFRRFSTTWWR